MFLSLLYVNSVLVAKQAEADMYSTDSVFMQLPKDKWELHLLKRVERSNVIRSRTLLSQWRSHFAFALLLHCYALWLAKKISRHFSKPIKSKLSQNQSWLSRMRFPVLGVGDICLLRVLIGSSDCLRLLWFARVITLVLVLRHANWKLL